MQSRDTELPEYKNKYEVVMSRWEYNSLMKHLRLAHGYARFGKDGTYSPFLVGWLGGMLDTLKAWDK